MGIASRDGCLAGKRAVFFVILVAAIALLWGQPPGYAADKKFVEGIVKSVSGTEIEVGGMTYDIAGVPLTAGPRKRVSPSDLAPGTKVTLIFRGGALRLVVVHPHIVE